MKIFKVYLRNSFFVCLISLLVFYFGDEVVMGFWYSVLFIILGPLLTAMGARVGRVFLDFVRPDAYFASGAFDSFLKNIFWRYGPQLIGGFLGYAIAYTLCFGGY